MLGRLCNVLGAPIDNATTYGSDATEAYHRAAAPLRTEGQAPGCFHRIKVIDLRFCRCDVVAKRGCWCSAGVGRDHVLLMELIRATSCRRMAACRCSLGSASDHAGQWLGSICSSRVF